jgi:phenylpropionate dioxygenase-like ring-hydroxylating dioxygenase large terminal subunit
MIGSIDYKHLIQADKVHGSLYTSEDIYADEMEKIFQNSWFYVGHESEIKEAGDFVSRDIGRSAVIMVRDKDNTVNVLVNRCSHRGNNLCNEMDGNKRNFSCLYHGWVFALNGDLLDVPYPDGFTKDKKDHGLQKLVTDSYRGFVFASFKEPTRSFDDYLGNGKKLIDRACNLSPEGEVDLTGGWVRQKFDANWKMLPENDTDGYHVNYVHQSFVQVIPSQYNEFVGGEDTNKGVIRDWGNGHTEIDFAAGYVNTLDWLGSTVEKSKSYVEKMHAAYGEEEGDRRMFDGPPHSCIFPNLFLAEMNIVIFQPTSVNSCVQWSTPMFLKGVPELNFKLLRQSEGALGPAAFLLADDATIAERAQKALQAGTPWCDLSRGIDREIVREDGVKESRMSDETSNRGFWHHYRSMMLGEK